MTTNTEDRATSQTPAQTDAPKAATKATRVPRKPRVAPAKGKSAKKARATQKRAKKPTGAKSAKTAREGSKSAKVLDLLRRPKGATLKELMKATGWQPHSVRGFLSGTIGKKMALTLTSTKEENGERTYSLKG